MSQQALTTSGGSIGKAQTQNGGGSEHGYDEIQKVEQINIMEHEDESEDIGEDEDYEVSESDIDHDSAPGTTHTGKRKYKYVKRKRKVRSSPALRAGWFSTLDSMSQAKLRRMVCCKKFQCFKNVPYDYFIQRCRHIISSSPSVRRNILNSMIDAEKNFVFNGKQVCVRFMKQSFHFSTEFLARDRKNHHLNELTEEQISTNECITTMTSSTSSRSGSESIYRSSPHKDAILSFLLRLGEDCSEKMPDTNELHLPFFQKKEVYCLFLSEYKKLYSDPAPTSHYFMFIWKHNCQHIKVRKVSRFTICDICEEIRSGMKEALVKGFKVDRLLARRSAHLKIVNDERMEYQKKKDRSRLNPSDYCSIIIDGADQRAYGLPHFTTKTKEQKGLAMKLKVIGLLEHDVQNVLHVYTMTEEHETGANHVIECIHRFLNTRRNKSPLPRTLFVQMDNCTRENKNRYVLSYFESLVALDIFDVIEIGFLPKGHTHEDVDQCFSQSACRLRQNNALNILQMHQELSQINRGFVEVSHIKRIVNWSGLCENESCIYGINNFTQYRYFKFSRSFQDDLDHGSPYSTICHVRLNCYEAWTPLVRPRKSQKPHGFLKVCPDIRKVPPLNIKCPEGEQKVILRLQSEEGRVNNSDVMQDLHELRRFVFQSRVDQFHWDTSSTIETSRCDMYHVVDNDNSIIPSNGDDMLNDVDEIQPSNVAINEGDDSNNLEIEMNPSTLEQEEDRKKTKAGGVPDLQPSSKFTYVPGSFVAVQPDGDESNRCPELSSTFWIAKVVSIKKNENESFVRHLKVHWYSPQRQEAPLQSEYYPLYETKVTKSRGGNARKFSRKDLKTAWTDEIDTDSVLVTFDSLTKRHLLPLAVRKKLSV